jgi:hypothetical protein
MGVYLAGGALGRMPNADSEQNIHPLRILALPGTAWKRHFQFVGILIGTAKSGGKTGASRGNDHPADKNCQLSEMSVHVQFILGAILQARTMRR